MTVVLDLLRIYSPRIEFMAKNKVVVILLVIDCLDYFAETLGCNSSTVPSFLQGTDRQALPQEQFLIERS
jgi:hypothetical protein